MSPRLRPGELRRGKPLWNPLSTEGLLRSPGAIVLELPWIKIPPRLNMLRI
jgi:hypothetical protein